MVNKQFDDKPTHGQSSGRLVNSQNTEFEGLDDLWTSKRCTDTSDLRHFGPKTFPNWCQSVQWTLRHQRKKF